MVEIDRVTSGYLTGQNVTSPPRSGYLTGLTLVDLTSPIRNWSGSIGLPNRSKHDKFPKVGFYQVRSGYFTGPILDLT